jgi:hypothetical protein
MADRKPDESHFLDNVCTQHEGKQTCKPANLQSPSKERRSMSISTYLATYKSLFVGRSDDYAMQLATGRYRRVGKPLTDADLHDHLIGARTYGTYVMDAAGRCRFAVIDADGEDGLARLWKLHDELAAHGITSYVECSRRGGHLWMFFTRPVPASQVRAWLLPYCPSDLEFYPKQDEGKGYGSLIRLPLGVHRKSGERYPFVARDEAGHLVPLTVAERDRVNWLASIIRLEVPQLAPTTQQATPSPMFSSPAPMQARANGASSPIREWNAAQDPIEVIGSYVVLNEAHVGQCPFGEHHTGGQDTNASFKVYKPGAPGGYCWYCYTWQQGGSVFDFLRHYYHLEAGELWKQIQKGGIA